MESFKDNSKAESVEDTPSKPIGLMKGLLITIPLLLVIEIGSKFLFKPETQLLDRLLVYILGLATILVLAFFTKSLLKMVFVGTPVIIITSFIPPYFLPNYFTSVFGLFGYSRPAVEQFIIILKHNPSLVPNSQQILNYSNYALTYFFVFDLVISLVLLTITAIGFTLLAKVFTRKPNAFTIILVIFMVVFLLIGAVALPYGLTVTSGVSQFSLDMSVGSTYLFNGIQDYMKNINTNNLTFAISQIQNSSSWFKEAKLVISSLNSLGISQLLSTSGLSTYQPIFDNGLIAVQGVTILAQAMSPLLVSFSGLKSGFDKTFGTISLSGSILKLSQSTSQKQFDAGIAELRQSFKNMTEAIRLVKEAVNTFKKMDQTSLEKSLLQTGVPQDMIKTISSMFTTTDLVQSALNVFNVMINPIQYNGTTSPDAPLIHLARGAYDLSRVSKLVGGTSSFEKTERYWPNIVQNISIFQETLKSPAYNNFSQINTSGLDPTIGNFVNQIKGAFNFVRDAGNVAIEFGNFGTNVVPVIRRMNTSLAIFQDPAKNFTTISDKEYDNSYNNLTQVITDSQGLNASAFKIKAITQNMTQNANNQSYYGLMTQPAKQFTALFSQFNLTQNAQNFIYLGNAFQNVILTAKELKKVDVFMKNIETDLTAVKNAGTTSQQATELNNRAPNINANVTLVDTALNNSKLYLGNAQGNFTLAYTKGGMTQLGTVNTALSNIAIDINDIQGPTALGKVKEIMKDPSTYASNNGGIGPTLSDLDTAIQNIVVGMGKISNDLKGVTISG